jgi:hypothetical protein
MLRADQRLRSEERVTTASNDWSSPFVIRQQVELDQLCAASIFGTGPNTAVPRVSSKRREAPAIVTWTTIGRFIPLKT